MKILITGGAGYIGSILTPMLLQQGHRVTVVDNFMYQQTSLLDCCFDSRLSIVKADVRDQRIMKEQLSQADAVLALACLTGAPLCDRDPAAARAINFDAVKWMFDQKSRDQLFIFPNTNSGYGVGQEGLFCDETSKLNPISLYGKLKVELEQYLLDRGDCVTFRFATVFGISPRMRLDLLVNDFVFRALRDRAVVLFEPHFKRNYLHVRDAAGAFTHAIQNYETMKNQPYNVGLSDANLSKEELCRVIQRILPKFQYLVSPIGEDPDKRNYIVSNKRIEATGYRTQVSLEDGLKELIKGLPIIQQPYFSNI